MRSVVYKSRLLCAAAVVALLITSCGQSREEKLESWETARRSAFQEFRDRRYEGAIASYQKALGLAKQIDANGVEVAITLNELAVVYNTKGNADETAKLYEESNAILERLANADNLNKDIVRAYCDALEGLGKIKEEKGDLPGAEALYGKAVNIAQRADSTVKLRELVYQYKSVLLQQGKDKEAAALQGQTERLSNEDQFTDRENYLHKHAKNCLRDAQQALGEQRIADADKAYQEAYGFARESKDLRFRGEVEGQIALYLLTVNKLRPAESAIVAALRDFKEAKVDDAAMLTQLVTYSSIEHALGKIDAADKAADLALKIAKAQFDEDSVEMQRALSAKANVYIALRKYKEALPLYEKTYALTKRHAALNSPMVIMHTCWLANIYWLAGQKSKAESLVGSYSDQVLKMRKELNLVSRLFNDYGNECRRTGDSVEARVFHNAAMRVAKQAPDAAVEIKRAQDGIKASQTRAAT